MERFIRRNGILQTWVAKKLDIHRSSLEWLFENGFSVEQKEILEDAIREAGELLARFEFGNNPRKELRFLRNECGVPSSYIAAQLGLEAQGVSWMFNRPKGMNEQEKSLIIAVLRDLSKEFLSFSIPKNELRKAA